MTEQQSDESARPRRALPPRRRRWIVLLSILLAVLVAGGAGALVYKDRLTRSLAEHLDTSAEMPSESGRPSAAAPADPSKGQALNFVLIGADSRPDEGDVGRSDSLMVAHLDADRKAAYLVSFPRDMWVSIPGNGEGKINAAYAFGGTSLTISTLEGVLDTRMDHVAVVDFEGFVQLTEVVGAVTVENEYEFTSHGYEYPKGKIKLEGKKALWFVRERHAFPTGDFQRAKNQRTFVKALLGKALSPSLIADPVKFNSFVAAVGDCLTVDSGLTADTILGLATSLDFEPDELQMLQAPVSGTGTSADGQSIDIVDEAQMAELGKALKNDTMADYVKKYPTD